MKKFTFLFAVCIIFGSTAFSQNELLVGWTFPTNSLVADTGLSLHPNNEISTMGGTSAIEIKNGFTTNAAQATEWNLGMETKAWFIVAKTTGYSNLTISSRQQSGGEEPGPKFFKIQFSINYGASWSEVIGGEITVENDWETSFVDKLSLPDDCDDQDEIGIRWVMALNVASGTGGAVAADGKSKIDEIFLHGDKINGLEYHNSASFVLFPNPACDYINITGNEMIEFVEIIDLTGKLLEKINVNGFSSTLDVSFLPKGFYFMYIRDKKGNNLIAQKFAISR